MEYHNATIVDKLIVVYPYRCLKQRVHRYLIEFRLLFLLEYRFWKFNLHRLGVSKYSLSIIVEENECNYVVLPSKMDNLITTENSLEQCRSL